MVETIETVVHGRYLVRTARSKCVLVGFHGYGESTEDQFTRLAAIPGSEAWVVASIQGLHRFYDRGAERVVASWMTRQDRELTIADNLTYVSRVIQRLLEPTAIDCIVFAGFSQGVAMAYRAAVSWSGTRPHVIAVGGDVPPEFDTSALRALSSVLVCRGAEDKWYAPDTFDNDVRRLKAAGVNVEPLVVTGGHEWGIGITEAAERFLRDKAATDR
jgi:predicted esterase